MKFEVREHVALDVSMVEVTEGEELLAAIYPTETGLRIISKHMRGASYSTEDIPVVEITLEVQP